MENLVLCMYMNVQKLIMYLERYLQKMQFTLVLEL